MAVRQNDQISYLHSDHLGTASLTTDVWGIGESPTAPPPLRQSQRWADGDPQTDFNFTGQRKAGFGLLDYNARYYDPVLGRFISPDSIVPDPTSGQGLSRYRYARNNPLKYNDPSGHCVGPAIIPCVIALAGVILGVTGSTPQDLSPEEETAAELGNALLVGDVNDVMTIATGYDVLNDQSVPYGSREWWKTVGWSSLPIVSRSAGNAVENLGAVNRAMSSKKVALGLNDHLLDFISTKGPTGYNITELHLSGMWQSVGLSTVNASGRNFPKGFEEAMNATDEIHFNLKGLTISKAMQDGSASWGELENNATNYELYRIVKNDTWFEKTKFYDNNGLLSPEKVKELFGEYR